MKRKTTSFLFERMRDEKRTKQLIQAFVVVDWHGTIQSKSGRRQKLNPQWEKIIPSGTLNIRYVRTCVLSIETISNTGTSSRWYYVSTP